MRSLCLDVRPSFNDQFSQFWEQCTANVRPLATFLFLAKFEYVNKLEKKYLSNPCFITSTRLPQALEFNQFKTDLPTSNPSLLASNALDPNDSVWFLNQPSQLCPPSCTPEGPLPRFSFLILSSTHMEVIHRDLNLTSCWSDHLAWWDTIIGSSPKKWNRTHRQQLCTKATWPRNYHVYGCVPSNTITWVEPLISTTIKIWGKSL